MFHFIAFGVVAVSLLVSACRSDSSEEQDSEAIPETWTNESLQEESATVPSGAPVKNVPKPCPEEMALVEGFCIDRYEAHLHLEGRDHPHNLRPPSEDKFEAASAPGVFPQGYISRPEAELACRRSRKRLCTLEEWLQACRGPSKRTYPYGEKLEKGRCNSSKPPLLSLLFKDKGPLTWSYEKHFNHPDLNITPGFLAETGEYAGCVSLYGVFDLVGNLHEWVADRVEKALAQKIPLSPALLEKLSQKSGLGIFMGGFYSTGSEHGSGCHFITIGHEPEYHDYSTGFRCCKDAEGK